MAARSTAVFRAAISLSPPDAAKNLRCSAVEARRNYAKVRIEGADALDVGRLAARFADCLFFVRDTPSGAAIDVYIPNSRSFAATALRASAAAAVVAALIALLAAANNS